MGKNLYRIFQLGIKRNIKVGLSSKCIINTTVIHCRKLKKPLKPKLTIQVASGAGKDAIPRPVQILSAYICDENEHQLMLMHGNHLRPTFEKVVSLNSFHTFMIHDV